MTDNLLQFDPNRRRRGQPPIPSKASPEHGHLHQRTRRAAPEARELALQQSMAARERYAIAQNAQEEERLLRTGTPIPARITIALDSGGHEGPEVDTACGAADPDVDLWECGELIPTSEQVKLLAKLTGFPVAYFYMPIEPGEFVGRMWICGPRKCESPEPARIDERGVLHYGGEPPRTPPTNRQQALF